jgi:hypothetical protein
MFSEKLIQANYSGKRSQKSCMSMIEQYDGGKKLGKLTVTRVYSTGEPDGLAPNVPPIQSVTKFSNSTATSSQTGT